MSGQSADWFDGVGHLRLNVENYLEFTVYLRGHVVLTLEGHARSLVSRRDKSHPHPAPSRPGRSLLHPHLRPGPEPQPDPLHPDSCLGSRSPGCTQGLPPPSYLKGRTLHPSPPPSPTSDNPDPHLLPTPLSSCPTAGPQDYNRGASPPQPALVDTSSPPSSASACLPPPQALLASSTRPHLGITCDWAGGIGLDP